MGSVLRRESRQRRAQAKALQDKQASSFTLSSQTLTRGLQGIFHHHSIHAAAVSVSVLSPRVLILSHCHRDPPERPRQGVWHGSSSVPLVFPVPVEMGGDAVPRAP